MVFNTFGGDKRDRTADLLNAIQALSQLSYTPIFGSLSDSFCIIAHLQKKSIPFFKKYRHLIPGCRIVYTLKNLASAVRMKMAPLL